MSILRVTVNYSFFGVTCQNVCHFKNADNTVSETAMCTEMKNNFIPQLMAVSGAAVVAVNVRVQRVDGTPTAGTNLAITIPGAQSGSLQQLTFECFLLRIGTGIAGRRNRGRIYVPGPNNNLTSSGLWTSGVTGPWVTSCNNILTLYRDGTGTFPAHLGVCPRNDPSDFKGCTTLSLAPTPAIQRRRNIGVGI